jgi:hypothetical protein
MVEIQGKVDTDTGDNQEKSQAHHYDAMMTL